MTRYGVLSYCLDPHDQGRYYRLNTFELRDFAERYYSDAQLNRKEIPSNMGPINVFVLPDGVMCSSLQFVLIEKGCSA